MKNQTYKSTGIVLGNYWGGGAGSYQARKFEADTKEELLKQANKALKDGSLDSGMGYESLIGALIEIEMIETVLIDGKEYSRSEFESTFIGNLTGDQEDFLLDVQY
jgi:hypothetical protein